MGWAFQKDSELVECFNYNLQKMLEAGILNNELRKTGPKYNADFRQHNHAYALDLVAPSLQLS